MDINEFIKQDIIARHQAEKEIKDESLEAIVAYFGNNSGVEKVVNTFGLEYNSLSVEMTNGVLNILQDAERRWHKAPVDKYGPTQEQEAELDNILMGTACDLFLLFKGNKNNEK